MLLYGAGVTALVCAFLVGRRIVAYAWVRYASDERLLAGVTRARWRYRDAPPLVRLIVDLLDAAAGQFDRAREVTLAWFDGASPPLPLRLELVPGTCHGSNARTYLKSSEWRRIREAVIAAAGRRCETCGRHEREVRGSMHCHEVWRYVSRWRLRRAGFLLLPRRCHTQRLVRLACRCAACHEATHLGWAYRSGNLARATRHFLSVTGWTQSQLGRHWQRSVYVCRRRERRAWEVDLGMILASSAHSKDR